jgi:hypothetical protein
MASSLANVSLAQLQLADHQGVQKGLAGAVLQVCLNSNMWMTTSARPLRMLQIVLTQLRTGAVQAQWTCAHKFRAPGCVRTGARLGLTGLGMHSVTQAPPQSHLQDH